MGVSGLTLVLCAGACSSGSVPLAGAGDGGPDAALDQDAGPLELREDAGMAPASDAGGDAGAPPIERMTPTVVPPEPEAAIDAGPRFVQLDVGMDHGCGVSEAGELHCWGSNVYGQLGLAEGAEMDPCPGYRPAFEDCRLAPTPVPGIADVAEVATGSNFTCVRHDDGAVDCWGSNWFGELSIPAGEVGLCEEPPRLPAVDPRPCSRSPVRVAGVDDAVSLRAGDYHACVVRASGEVVCWGMETTASAGPLLGQCQVPVPGQLQPCMLPPHPVALEGRVVQIATGFMNRLALMEDGRVIEWGRTAPRVIDVPPADHISIGNHGCARTRQGGTTVCWGSNQFGQLGTACTEMECDGPLELPGVPAGAAPVVGMTYACALDAEGAIHCIGHYPSEASFFGPPFNGEYCAPCSGDCPSCNGFAQAAEADGDRVSLHAGNGFMCALRIDGSFECIGADGLGQRGDGP